MTAALYLARVFITQLGAVLLGFFSLVLLVEVVEHLQRDAVIVGAPLLSAVTLALLKAPDSWQRTIPFALLFASLLMFWQLERRHELVSLRAAGLPVRRLLYPFVAVTLIVMTLKIALIGPLAAGASRLHEGMRSSRVQDMAATLSFSGAGLWLRQPTPSGGSAVIRSGGIDLTTRAFQQVTVYLHDTDGQFIRRVDSSTARLEGGQWIFFDAAINEPRRPTRTEPLLSLPTTLTLSTIEENLAPPETQSIWALPAFIDALEQSGFSTPRHQLHLQKQLAEPLLGLAMVLIAAVCSARLARDGGALGVGLVGALVGVMVYIVTDVIGAMGSVGALSIPLAAWGPPLISMGLALVALKAVGNR
jgi:lipopolysaccharide export system permease protein